MSNRTVLYAEDDSDAIFFFRRAVEKGGLDIDLKHVENGEEAIAYLEGLPPYGDRAIYPTPSLILLDLKMPLKDGFEVLAWIKATDHIRDIPVYILTSSDRQEDIDRATEMQATGYLTKTTTFDTIIDSLKSKF